MDNKSESLSRPTEAVKSESAVCDYKLDLRCFSCYVESVSKRYMREVIKGFLMKHTDMFVLDYYYDKRKTDAGYKVYLRCCINRN